MFCLQCNDDYSVLWRMQDAIEACYSILGTVQRLWRRVKDEDDDDYIAIPKPSGYQSLHTAVIGTCLTSRGIGAHTSPKLW